jgi:hypothetical protein
VLGTSDAGISIIEYPAPPPPEDWLVLAPPNV